MTLSFSISHFTLVIGHWSLVFFYFLFCKYNFFILKGRKHRMDSNVRQLILDGK